MSLTGEIVNGELVNAAETLTIQKFYVDAAGAFLGSTVDGNPDDVPEGWIEVPYGPQQNDQIWQFPDGPYGPSLYLATTEENAWREAELLIAKEQLDMLEDDDPNALPGDQVDWRAYRIQLRAWKTGNPEFPFGTRPARPQ